MVTVPEARHELCVATLYVTLQHGGERRPSYEQGQLATMGIEFDKDDDFGEQTEAAIRANFGDPVDSRLVTIVSPQTWTAMVAAR